MSKILEVDDFRLSSQEELVLRILSRRKKNEDPEELPPWASSCIRFLQGLGYISVGTQQEITRKGREYLKGV